MKLVRNTTEDGSGKYMLILTRKLELYRPTGTPFEANAVLDAIELLRSEGVLDDPVPESEGEFFVIRLRDKYARAALLAYAMAAYEDDPEYADEITEMANRAGPNSPFVKRPD